MQVKDLISCHYEIINIIFCPDHLLRNCVLVAVSSPEFKRGGAKSHDTYTILRYSAMRVQTGGLINIIQHPIYFPNMRILFLDSQWQEVPKVHYLL